MIRFRLGNVHFAGGVPGAEQEGVLREAGAPRAQAGQQRGKLGLGDALEEPGAAQNG